MGADRLGEEEKEGENCVPQLCTFGGKIAKNSVPHAASLLEITDTIYAIL